MISASIAACKVENLRSYSTTGCKFGGFTVLVGENNEGKSSILKMLDFLVNKADEDFLAGRRRLTKHEEAFWMPANEAHHKARRFTVDLHIPDGRVARSFECDQTKRVELRLSVSTSNMRARLNYGPPRRGERHDDKALELLRKLKNSVDVVLIPAVRDATSSRFAAKLATQVDEVIGKKLHQQKRGGSYAEYRKSLDVMELLEQIVSMNRKGLDVSAGMGILKRMIKDTEVRFEAGVDEIMRWIKDNLHVAVSTGSHDVLKVRASEVGNGLQSIIDIALTVGSYAPESERQLFLIVEEPEAFLHPSAQRDLIIGLQQTAAQVNRQIVVTTHSPILVDETKYGDTTLVRDQHFYPPSVVDKRRCEINTSLMTVSNSEVFFSSLVLLVEGPGDKAFFDVLLKRLRRLGVAEGLTKVVVQHTDGKRGFAPWIRLFKCYGVESKRPIRWFSVMDADAARKDDGGQRAILRALRDSSSVIPPELEHKIIEFGDMDYTKRESRRSRVAELNRELERYPCALFSVDLEWAIVNEGSAEAAAVLTRIFEQEGFDATGDSLDKATRLGSRARGSVSGEPLKQPWLRARIAEHMPFNALSGEIERIVKSALCQLSEVEETSVESIWREAQKSNPTL